MLTPYQARRNALIPAAERYANSVCSSREQQWTLVFLARMHELAVQAGLVSA